ncbi:MAG: hypothetical protein HY320_03340 [Armatimonadetes bacterium]|nr:hypothetical protein [Armatimonadota bacterium]
MDEIRSAQDDARERQLIELFALEGGRHRSGSDARLVLRGHIEEPFEVKSITTTKGVSTVRDLNDEHFHKWTGRHWLIGVYQGRTDLKYCWYASPDDMAPWIQAKREYMLTDVKLAELVPSKVTVDVLHEVVGRKDVYDLADAKKLQKRQYGAREYREKMDVSGGYSPQRMLEILRERCAYLLARGSTLNNPSIPISYFKDFERIDPEDPGKARARLRTLVQAWLDKKKRR